MCASFPWVLVRLAARLAAAPQPSTALHLSFMVAMLLLCTQGFHQRWLYLVICAALAVATVLAPQVGRRSQALGPAAALVLAGSFTVLPVHKAPALALVIAPCIAWAALVAGLSMRGTSSPSAADSTSRQQVFGAFWSSPRARRVMQAQALALLLCAVCICATEHIGGGSSAGNPLARLNAALSAAAVPLQQMLMSEGWGPLAGVTAAQLVMRALFVITPGLALLVPQQMRLESIMIGFAAPFAVMSIAWEGVFLLCLSLALLLYKHFVCERTSLKLFTAKVGNGLHLPRAPAVRRQPQIERIVIWPSTELPPRQARQRRRQGDPAAQATEGARSNGDSKDGQVGGLISLAWTAALLIAAINLAFFGTGNMASVASFEPASVLRLLTYVPFPLPSHHEQHVL